MNTPFFFICNMSTHLGHAAVMCVCPFFCCIVTRALVSFSPFQRVPQSVSSPFAPFQDSIAQQLSQTCAKLGKPDPFARRSSTASTDSRASSVWLGVSGSSGGGSGGGGGGAFGRTMTRSHSAQRPPRLQPLSPVAAVSPHASVSFAASPGRAIGGGAGGGGGGGGGGGAFGTFNPLPRTPSARRGILSPKKHHLAALPLSALPSSPISAGGSSRGLFGTRGSPAAADSQKRGGADATVAPLPPDHASKTVASAMAEWEQRPFMRDLRDPTTVEAARQREQLREDAGLAGLEAQMTRDHEAAMRRGEGEGQPEAAQPVTLGSDTTTTGDAGVAGAGGAPVLAPALEDGSPVPATPLSTAPPAFTLPARDDVVPSLVPETPTAMGSAAQLLAAGGHGASSGSLLLPERDTIVAGGEFAAFSTPSKRKVATVNYFGQVSKERLRDEYSVLRARRTSAQYGVAAVRACHLWCVCVCVRVCVCVCVCVADVPLPIMAVACAACVCVRARAHGQLLMCRCGLFVVVFPHSITLCSVAPPPTPNTRHHHGHTHTHWHNTRHTDRLGKSSAIAPVTCSARCHPVGVWVTVAPRRTRSRRKDARRGCRRRQN